MYYFLVLNGPYGHIYLLGHPMGCPISHPIYGTIFGPPSEPGFSLYVFWLLPISFYVTTLTSMGLHNVPLCLYGPQFWPLLASMCLFGHRYAPMGLFKPLWAIRDMLTWASMSPFGPIMLAISE